MNGPTQLWAGHMECHQKHAFEHLSPQLRRLLPPDRLRLAVRIKAADKIEVSRIERFTEQECEVLLVPTTSEVRMGCGTGSLMAILEQQICPANVDLLIVESEATNSLQSFDANGFHPALIVMSDQSEPIKHLKTYEVLTSLGYRFSGVIEGKSVWTDSSLPNTPNELPIRTLPVTVVDLRRMGVGQVSLDSPPVAPPTVFSVSSRSELQLTGWAFGDLDQPVPSSILFRVRHEQTDVEEYVVGERFNRPDVAQHFQREHLLTSGFRVDLSGPCRRWGVHAVSVIQTSSTGRYESPTVLRFALAAQSYETSARAGLANRYLRGSGIEIGALQLPTPLPPSCQVRYVDRMPLDQLLQHYPELAALPIQAPDLIDDGELLTHIADASQDFVIANHFLEHCENPVNSIRNLLRVLRTGGILFMAVPDKRHTFDMRRPITRYELLKETARIGHRPDRESLFLEWAQTVSRLEGAKAVARACELLAENYSIHFNVWSLGGLLDFFLQTQRDFNLPLEVLATVSSENEIIVIIERLAFDGRDPRS